MSARDQLDQYAYNHRRRWHPIPYRILGPANNAVVRPDCRQIGQNDFDIDTCSAPVAWWGVAELLLALGLSPLTLLEPQSGFGDKLLEI